MWENKLHNLGGVGVDRGGDEMERGYKNPAVLGCGQIRSLIPMSWDKQSCYRVKSGATEPPATRCHVWANSLEHPCYPEGNMQETG